MTGHHPGMLRDRRSPSSAESSARATPCYSYWPATRMVKKEAIDNSERGFVLSRSRGRFRRIVITLANKIGNVFSRNRWAQMISLRHIAPQQHQIIQRGLFLDTLGYRL
jgi:hypothetical protein